MQKYDISTGVPFLIFKEHYVKNEIDKYISTMRKGYSVQSVDEYRTLKKAMALYAKYEYKFDEETITIIAAAIGKSVKGTKRLSVPELTARTILIFTVNTPTRTERARQRT